MLSLAQAADMTGALAAYKLALAEERIAELQGRLEEMRQERDRARAGEDAWKAQCEAVARQTALPAPHDARTAKEPPTRSRHGIGPQRDGCGRSGALRARACCSPYRPCPRVLNNSRHCNSSRNSRCRPRNSRPRQDASRLR